MLCGPECWIECGRHTCIDYCSKIERIFGDQTPPVSVPIELIQSCFYIFENDSDNESKHHRLFGFHEWLNAIAHSNPEQALAVAKIYLTYVKSCKPYLYDHKTASPN